MALIPGIRFPGRDWIIPPLSLGDLEVLQERLSELRPGATDVGSIRTIVDAAHAAVRRNYPDVTREQVADAVDLGNMIDVIEAVMDVAGVKRKSLEVSAKNPEAAPSPASP